MWHMSWTSQKRNFVCRNALTARNAIAFARYAHATVRSVCQTKSGKIVLLQHFFGKYRGIGGKWHSSKFVIFGYFDKKTSFNSLELKPVFADHHRFNNCSQMLSSAFWQNFSSFQNVHEFSSSGVKLNWPRILSHYWTSGDFGNEQKLNKSFHFYIIVFGFDNNLNIQMGYLYPQMATGGGSAN